MYKIAQTALLMLSIGFGTFNMAAAPAAVEKANNILTAVKKAEAPDARQVVFDIKAWTNAKGQLVVGGNTSEQAVRNAVVTELNKAGIKFADSINVYPTDRWAQVRIPAASLRTGGRHAAEMATQAILGTPLRVLDSTGEWWYVQTPDGYIAYVPSTSVVAKTPAEMEQWRSARRFIVTSPYQIRVYNTPTTTGVREVVTDLVNGCIVTAVDGNPTATEGRYFVELPDGRRGYVDADAVAPIEEWAAQNFNPDQILDIAYSMEGTPYLWGGMSTKALDCSGLAKVSYFSNGIILMRDASQQALTGTRIEAKDWRNCQAGDLLFFGNAKTGKVTHVAIYDHDGNYVHSSGRVKRNSVDPESPAYLTTPFLHAVRIAGNEGTRGITHARNHPWYF
ncbi:MAG: C40 family peptidase [Muribaculaceae bacterium]|nr:C40 family peptidase [Muribaculaceae bacterium]